MHFTKVFALAAIFATGALAAPVAEADATTPTRPKKPVVNRPKINIVNQSNVCGNGVTPFCCSQDGFGKTSCKAFGKLFLFWMQLSSSKKAPPRLSSMLNTSFYRSRLHMPDHYRLLQCRRCKSSAFGVLHRVLSSAQSVQVCLGNVNVIVN